MASFRCYFKCLSGGEGDLNTNTFIHIYASKRKGLPLFTKPYSHVDPEVGVGIRITGG